jgi:AraC-like DNA-binding protein
MTNHLQSKPKTEKVRFWRDPNFGYLEARYSRYKTISFPKHTHDALSIGMVEQGQSSFYYRGKVNSIGPGGIAIIQPGEVHACNPQADTGWTYRMFYVNPYWMCKIADEITSRRSDIPSFSAPVIQNSTFFHALTHLHSLLESPTCQLEKESSVYTIFTQLIAHYGDRTPKSRTRDKEPHTVKIALEYLADNVAQNISLEELSALTGLSAYHFLRVFRNTVGLPPHAYQTQLRINLAKRLLVEGEEIVQVAYDTGFADQSHFSNKFKSVVGATPRQYKLAQHSTCQI